MRIVGVILVSLLPVCFAGMAFPVPMATFAEQLFQQEVNPNIRWDPTNYLIDLSGPYTLCNKVGRYGVFNVFETTKDGGASIAGLVETTKSTGDTVSKASIDIQRVLKTWVNKSPFKDQIKEASTFGCSVQPSCPSGQSVIGCLFSPKLQGAQPIAKQKALAFTFEQYELAESVTGNTWDRSHFLENLSGYETDCAMIGKREWAFAKAKAEGTKRRMRVDGVFGSAPNGGDTTKAIRTVLRSWKKIKAFQVGCSVIPDCKGDSGLTTVVSCIFRE